VNPQDGAINLHDGAIRLMRPEGSFEDFTYEQYSDIIGEHIEPWSYGKMPYARSWNEGFSMDLQAPKGIYRANTLARINVCDLFVLRGSLFTLVSAASLPSFVMHRQPDGFFLRIGPFHPVFAVGGNVD
jgi:hypothetical protein